MLCKNNSRSRTCCCHKSSLMQKRNRQHTKSSLRLFMRLVCDSRCQSLYIILYCDFKIRTSTRLLCYCTEFFMNSCLPLHCYTIIMIKIQFGAKFEMNIRIDILVFYPMYQIVERIMQLLIPLNTFILIYIWIQRRPPMQLIILINYFSVIEGITY